MESSLRHEAFVHEHADGPSEELILAGVLERALDERRGVLARHADVLELRREVEHRDGHLMSDAIAGQADKSLDIVGERQRITIDSCWRAWCVELCLILCCRSRDSPRRLSLHLPLGRSQTGPSHPGQ